MTHKLVMLSGPSGVGKGEIIDWLLKLFHPEFFEKNNRYRKDVIDFCIVPVYKIGSRDGGGKAGESKYGKSRSKNVYPFSCRGNEQEINLDELDSAIEKHDAVLIEAYYKTFDFLKNRFYSTTDFSSTFISPLDIREIRELKEHKVNLEDYLPDLMADSLARRAVLSGDIHTIKLNEKIKSRAKDSVNEMLFAHNYKHVIPNHCHESDSRWKFPYLVGEPSRVVKTLYDIFTTGKSDYAYCGKDYDLFRP